MELTSKTVATRAGKRGSRAVSDDAVGGGVRRARGSQQGAGANEGGRGDGEDGDGTHVEDDEDVGVEEGGEKSVRGKLW